MKAVIYSPLDWDHACFAIRLAGPLKTIGWQLVAGDMLDPEAGCVSKADLVIIHREYSAWGKNYKGIVERCRREGKPLIMDIDDLLIDVPEEHFSYPMYFPMQEDIKRGISEANAVIVSTEELASHLSRLNKRIFTVPNYLNDSYWPRLRPAEPDPDKDGPVIIGYAGTNSHKDDLEFISGALLDIAKSYSGRIELKFWGVAPPEKLRGLDEVDWIPLNLSSYESFADYFAGRRCDIVLAPLTDNSFNRCKSNIKFLEFSRCAMPGVYSRLTPYETTVTNGNTGFLASGREEWVDCIRQLIDDKELRRGIAKQAHSLVQDSYLLSSKAEALKKAYQDILHAARTEESIKT